MVTRRSPKEWLIQKVGDHRHVQQEINESTLDHRYFIQDRISLAGSSRPSVSVMSSQEPDPEIRMSMAAHPMVRARK